jgi:hypothetical protein
MSIDSTGVKKNICRKTSDPKPKRANTQNSFTTKKKSHTAFVDKKGAILPHSTVNMS